MIRVGLDCVVGLSCRLYLSLSSLSLRYRVLAWHVQLLAKGVKCRLFERRCRQAGPEADLAESVRAL